MIPKTPRERLAQQLDLDRPYMVKADSYYRGDQPLAYLDPAVADRLRGRLSPIVVNWPRVVVDALEERLDVEGFRTSPDATTDAELWRIWQANNLDEASEQAHLDALVLGRSYVMVWAGADPRTPRITVESALQTIVERDPATGMIVAGLKRWLDLYGYGHALVFTPDSVEEYQTRTPQMDTSTLDTGPGMWELVNATPNPLGMVPIVPIVNRARVMAPEGESELADVMPLADAVNKLATDMMVSAEYHAQPRRWITGLIGEGSTRDQAREAGAAVETVWENARASKLWIAPGEGTRFGQFPEASLDNFTGAIRMLTQQIAAITGLPPHYLGLTTDNPASADAIRSAESVLVSRARRRQRAWSGSWEAVMRLAVFIRDGRYPTELDGLETIWRSPETATIAQSADAAVKLYAAGIVDQQAALEDLDYSPAAIARLTESDTVIAPEGVLA